MACCSLWGRTTVSQEASVGLEGVEGQGRGHHPNSWARDQIVERSDRQSARSMQQREARQGEWVV